MVWRFTKDYGFWSVGHRTMPRKYALFDLDGTLITPRDGFSPPEYSKSPEPNYIFLGKEKIMTTFQELRSLGYTLAIISNQPNFNPNVKKRFIAIQKDFQNTLGWSPDICICISQKYQKPSTKIMKLFPGFFTVNSESKSSESFFCGDAVGKDDPYPPYRWSNVDLRFAQNLNLNFIRPIELFEHYTPKSVNHQELIVMMGMPGSGKSRLAYEFELGSFNFPNSYINCETDMMPNYDRKFTLECVENNLQVGKSVIANANNPSRANRKEFIDIARKYHIPVRIFWFIRDGRAFNSLRGKEPKTEDSEVFYHSKPVPKSAFDRYVSLFEDPTKDGEELEIIY